MSGKVSCWEFMTCKKSECPVYGQREVECWRVPDTLCHGEETLFTEKLGRCIECPVFRRNIEDEKLCMNLSQFYKLLKENDCRPDSLKEELAVELTEVYGMLYKLSQGDFSARVRLAPCTTMITSLKSMLNDVASQMQEYVEDTHELAIGMCEHYETLNRICRNEFGARAAEDSSNELIAKLGTLINKCTDTLTSSIFHSEQAEEEAKNAYQQLLNIVEFLPDATFVIDGKGCVIAWNRALQELTGVGEAEMLGKGDYAYSVPFYGTRRKVLIDYLEEGADVALRKQYTNIRRTHNTLSGEASITPTFSENVRHVWVTATPLYDKNGNRAGGIESVRDVTELKQAEEEKARLEAQLHHSRQMESLMLKLGHDLKTPLTPLFTLLPLIRERVDDPDTQRMLDICCSNAQHIMNLSSKTMRLAGLSSFTGEAMREVLDLGPAVQGVCLEQSEMMELKNLRYEISIPGGLFASVVFDQIRDLLSNLISNAVNASFIGGGIRISARKKGDMVEVTVMDEGTGLTAEHTEIIFEEFFKVDEARQDPSTLGLGLSICKRIVLNHGGRIWAESKGLGYGTSILFTLPRHT